MAENQLVPVRAANLRGLLYCSGRGLCTQAQRGSQHQPLPATEWQPKAAGGGTCPWLGHPRLGPELGTGLETGRACPRLGTGRWPAALRRPSAVGCSVWLASLAWRHTGFSVCTPCSDPSRIFLCEAIPPSSLWSRLLHRCSCLSCPHTPPASTAPQCSTSHLILARP